MYDDDVMARCYLLLLVLLLSTQHGIAASARTCRLTLVGVPGQQVPGQLQEASLACSPETPPVHVAINGTYMRRFASSFSGVSVAEQEGCGAKSKGTHAAMLRFCHQGSLHFEEVVLKDVYLPSPAQQHPRSDCKGEAWLSALVVVDGGAVTFRKGMLHRNIVSTVVAAVNGAVLSLQNGTVVSSNQCTTGAISSYGGSELAIHHSVLTNNSGPSSCAFGGAVYAEGGTVLITRSNFSHNSAHVGGGLSLEYGCSAVLQHTRFTSNSAFEGAGVAVAGEGSVLRLQNCVLHNNTATESGAGAGASDGAQLVVDNCTFTANIAVNAGGALYASSDARLSVSGTNCFGNVARSSGGGVAVVDSVANISRSSFRENNATTGGGVYVGVGDGDTPTEARIEGCNIVGNRALSHGAGVLPGSNADELDAGVGAGLLVLNGAFASVTASHIMHNLAYLNGGGIAAHWNGTTVEMANCTVAGNTAYGKGGGVFVTQEAALGFTGGIIASNTAENGGGLAVTYGANASVCTLFRNNTAYALGGAVYLDPTVFDPYLHQALSLNYSFSMCAGVSFVRNNAAGGGADLFAGPSYRVLLGDRPLDPRGKHNGLNTANKTVIWNRRTWDACLPGEFLAEDTGFCQLCPPATYILGSIIPGPLACKPCDPATMHCPGGHVTIALSGFWNHPPLARCPECAVDYMHCCPNPLACRHHDLSTLAGHYLAAAAMNGSNSEAAATVAWQSYTSALCIGGQGQDSPYHGVLCGECLKGYGSSSPFACSKCPPGRTAPLLFALNALLSVAWGVFISLCSHKANLNGDDSRQMQPVDVLKVVALYLQYTRILAYDLHVRWWPRQLAAVFESISGGGSSKGTVGHLLRYLTPVPMDCVFAALGWDLGPHRAGVKALLMLFAPGAVFAVVVVLQVGWWYWQRSGFQPLPVVLLHLRRRNLFPGLTARFRRASRGSSANRPLPNLIEYMVVVALAVMYSWYTLIARLAVATVTCPRTCPVGQQGRGCSWWSLDMSLVCPFGPFTLPQGGWALGVGLPAWLCVAAAPLAAAAVMVWGSHTQQQQPPQQPSQQQQLAPQPSQQLRSQGNIYNERFRAMFGFCFAETDYEPCLAVLSQPQSAWLQGSWVKAHLLLGWHALAYFQMFVLSCLAVAGALLNEYHQLLLLTSALGCYLLLVVWLRPFRSPGTQRLHGFMLAVLCTTCICVMAFVVPAGVNPESLYGAQQVIGWFVLFQNGLFMMLALGLLVTSWSPGSSHWTLQKSSRAPNSPSCLASVGKGASACLSASAVLECVRSGVKSVSLGSLQSGRRSSRSDSDSGTT